MAIRLEDGGRRFRVVDGRRGPVVDRHLGGEQRLAVLVRQQQDRLRHVADRPLGQARLIVLDQRDDVAAGNVAVVDDGEAGGVEIEADVRNLSGRDGRSDGARVQEVGEREVVDVPRGAGDLLDAFLAKDVAADRVRRASHRAIISS